MTPYFKIKTSIVILFATPTTLALKHIQPI